MSVWGSYAPVLAPSFDSSSLEAPSAVHHAVRMSSRRLPVIIFVSLIEFMIMFMLCVVLGGRRRLLHHLRAIARLPLRLVQSSVPPPASAMSLHNRWLSDFSFLMLPIYDAYSISSVCFLSQSVIIIC